MNYQQPHQQSYSNFQPSYSQQDLTQGLPFLNQNGSTMAAQRGMMPMMTEAPIPQQQLHYRTSSNSLAGQQQQQQQQAQVSPTQYNFQQQAQSRPQSTYSINNHDASTYAPSSPGGTSFMTMSERRMSRDSTMEGMDDARPLAQQDFYRRPDDAGSRLSQNMSLRRGSMVSQNPMDPLRRPHVAPPIFTQNNHSNASFDTRRSSAAYSRTYPYPHPNAPEPTAGFPYAFPDPDMGDPASPTSAGLSHPQLTTILSDSTPYSRSPELRVSHKLAERKRRKEMKDLFDDLRDKLPLDRTLKTSKWEILSKAVEHVQYLEDQMNALRRENDDLRRGQSMTNNNGMSGGMSGGYGQPLGRD